MPRSDQAALIRARLPRLEALLSPCRLCPRVCGVERAKGARGFCGLADSLLVYCANVHHGEEPPLSGSRGSGTVFFSGCNLRCLFCQNYAFSQLMNGEAMTPAGLAGQMLALERRGAHNINWVTPTPQVVRAVEALAIAREGGLTIPLVFNCSGYESVEVLHLLDGIVDIYLPDAKYADSASAQSCSSAPDYPGANQAALREMHRQVGNLELDKDGIAVRGMLVRHLVLPGNLAGTREVLAFLASSFGKDVAISLMRQYFPAHRAQDHPGLGRRITWEEYEQALHAFDNLGLTTAFIQEWDE